MSKIKFETERVEKLYNRLQEKGTYIDINRAKYFTESFKQTEGEDLSLRFAKALLHIAKNIEIRIEDDQLLVGQVGGPERYGILYPELDGCFLSNLQEVLDDRAEASFILRPEDRKYLIEEVAPYWKDKSYYDDFAAALPEDLLRLTFDPKQVTRSRFLINETATMNSATQWVHDYKVGLERGFLSLQQEARSEKEVVEATLKSSMLSDETKAQLEKERDFLEGQIFVTEAIMVYADRYSKKAKELALQTEDATRKQELLTIAEITEWVPRYPARTFREAVQSQYFMQMFSRLEQKTGGTISNGRMDQYLYPYYKQDIEKGRISDHEVKELLSCLWIGMAQFRDVYVSPAGGAFSNGYAHWEAVTIGGLTPDGEDATNELSYIFLENKRDLPLDYPDLAARVHSKSPERFLTEIAKTIKEGTGHPKLLNDDEIIPVYLQKGAELKEANDYSVSGCTETRLVNRETWTSKGPAINLAALIELTLRNGRMKAYGDELLTIETGELSEFTTWDKFYDAFKKQEEYYITKTCEQIGYVHRVRENHFASPFGSVLHGLCRKNHADLHSLKQKDALDLAFFDMVGYATTVDSLSAIRKNVYEQSYTTLEELVTAMDADYEGYEVLRQRLIHSPAYGNNDESVDAIAKEIDLIATQVAQREAGRIQDNLIIDVRYVPVSANVAMGRIVSALPDGRLEGTALSDGTSAAHGADVNGPTAVLMSNYHTKNTSHYNRAARLLNLKFSNASLAGETGTERLVHLIKSWCDLKLWHIQFNVISQETLLDAKAHPEQYRNLIVRVAGYSAYFVNLSEDLQDDIIRRTSHESVA